MISKQLLWRCSNRIISILFISLIFSTTFSMDYFYKMYSALKQTDKKKDSGITSWNDAPPPSRDMPKTVMCEDSNDYALVPEMSEEQKKNYVACGKTWQELMEVFQDAPEDMKNIVTHLKKPLDPEWRVAFIVGPPGIGKSTATIAIPHVARWYWKFLSGSELAGQYRNETKERLALELRMAINRKKKVIVIIDEINRLLENFNSNDDTTAAFLWTFLEEQKKNHNFFLIGIMNRNDKIPNHIKHQLGGSTIFFPAIENRQKLLTIFKKIIARNPAIAFDSECNDSFLTNCFNSLENEGIVLTPRDYENIRFQIARLTARDDNTSAVRKIKQQHVTQAIQEVAKAYTRSENGKENTTL